MTKKTTKRALIVSILSLILCFTMLIGTTFAWFTDSVKSGKNRIVAGNLDVELEYLKDGEWETVRGADDLFEGTLWEPGHTEVIYLRLSNLGTLALKYELGINIVSEIAGTNVAGEEFLLSDHIYMGVAEGKEPSYASRSAAQAAVKDTAGKISEGYVADGEMIAGQEAVYLAVVVYMPETVDNEANYRGENAPEISLGINLVATQLMNEEDSFGKDYDEAAKYVISSDEKMIFNGNEFDTLVSNNGTVDMTNVKIENDNTGFENYGDATLTDVTINAGTTGYTGIGYALNSLKGSNTVLENVIINASNGIIGATGGAQVTVNSGTYVLASANTSGRYVVYAVDNGTVVTINGGDFSIPAKLPNGNSQNMKRAYIYVGEGATVEINGGNFAAYKPNTAKGYSAIMGTGNVIITGGTFGFDPTAWVAGGYEAVKTGNTWTVQPVSADIATVLTGEEKNIVVVLNDDVDLPITSLGSITPGSGEYKLGGQNTETITIDLNGHKLNITTGYWSAIGAKNNDATITIKNGIMTSSGNSAGTWNAYDVRLCNCNYVIKDVVFEKAVAIDNAGKSITLKNVTINETKDKYALWITAEGQNVAIDGLKIESAGRGIKIDEQYVDAPSKVTLSVSNATFNTVKKGAIMVKSAAGADIALNNVDISGVTADSTNAVWNDSDASAYFDLVTVTGGTKAQES